eukprot:4898590-Lingulodinium_polyedra.AAC.1
MTAATANRSVYSRTGRSGKNREQCLRIAVHGAGVFAKGCRIVKTSRAAGTPRASSSGNVAIMVGK